MNDRIAVLMERKTRAAKARTDAARSRAFAMAKTNPDAAAELLNQANMAEVVECSAIREMATMPVLCDFAAERAALQLSRQYIRPSAGGALA